MSDYKTIKMSLDAANLKNSDTFTCDNNCDFFKNMQIFFENQMLCDVTLNCANGDVKLKAHRMVLAASSVYFRSMFCGSLKEAEAAEVNFDQIDEHTLKSVIGYIYSKSIELNIDTVENIIKAAHLFQLETLGVGCCDYLAKHLEPYNCLGIVLFAEKYDYSKLYEISFDFVLQNFMKLHSLGEFFMLEADMLSKLLSSNEVRVSSEEVLFHSLMSWIEHDKVNRQQYLAQLIKHVRFELLRSKFIKDSVEQAICDISSDYYLIYQIYKMHLFPAGGPILHSGEQVNIRNLKDVIIAISGWTLHNTERVLNVGLYYDGFDEWIYKKWPGPPVIRTSFGATTLGEQLIIAGGKSSSETVSGRVDCLNLRTLEWTNLSPMLTMRHSCGMAALNGCIYAVGGVDVNGGAISSVEKYNPLTEEWKYVAPLPVSDSKPFVTIKSDSLCVAVNTTKSVYENGYNVKKNIRQLYTYNPQTNEWCKWIESKLDLVGMVTVPFNGVDHFTEVSKTEITSTNLESNTTTKTPSTFDFDATSVAIFGGRIVVHNETIFKEHADFGTWKTMPILENSCGRVVLISQ